MSVSMSMPEIESHSIEEGPLHERLSALLMQVFPIWAADIKAPGNSDSLRSEFNLVRMVYRDPEGLFPDVVRRLLRGVGVALFGEDYWKRKLYERDKKVLEGVWLQLCGVLLGVIDAESSAERKQQTIQTLKRVADIMELDFDMLDQYKQHMGDVEVSDYHKDKGEPRVDAWVSLRKELFFSLLGLLPEDSR